MDLVHVAEVPLNPLSLAHIHKDGLVGDLCGLVQVAVVEHDKRALPAELQGDPLQVGLAGGGEDEFPHLAGSGEGHLANVHAC